MSNELFRISGFPVGYKGNFSELFAPYGQVLGTEIPLDWDTELPLAQVAFVEIEVEDWEWVQRELNGSTFAGTKIRVGRWMGGYDDRPWNVARGYAGSHRPPAESYYSTFISYGSPDTSFAEKLNLVLRAEGVRTFFFPSDAPAGQKLHRLMRESINRNERAILVCSRSSLLRPGVLNEIAEALQREAREGGQDYLTPISLDDYVFTDWKPPDPGIAQAIRDRVVADFRGTQADHAKFDEAVNRLLSVLKR